MPIWNKINANWITDLLQSITTCWPLLCLNREGSLHLMHGKTWWSIQDKFYKSKTSSCFPIFDASNTWQMDFAAWLDLTSNANNTITVYQLTSKFQNTFWFFKTCWWLTGLSRLYDASQPPGRHTRYFKTMLKGPLTDSCMRSRAMLRRWNFTSGYLRQPEHGK